MIAEIPAACSSALVSHSAAMLLHLRPRIGLLPSAALQGRQATTQRNVTSKADKAQRKNGNWATVRPAVAQPSSSMFAKTSYRQNYHWPGLQMPSNIPMPLPDPPTIDKALGFELMSTTRRRYMRSYQLPMRVPPQPLPRLPPTTTLRNFREMEKVSSYEEDTMSSNNRTFGVASYNVLCQRTMQRTDYLYDHLPKNAYGRRWDYRKNLLRQEFETLLQSGAEIFCLQEVQFDHFDEFYRPFFANVGFSGHFTQRTGENPDGCATFYRKDTFQCDQTLDITYNHRCTGLDRDNVAHILQLKDIASGRVLFVGNTHLLFNPKRGDVKLGQIGLLFANLQQQIEKFMSTNSSASFGGYFMCGDFNLEPLSPLYRFVVERKIDLSGYSSAALGRSPLQNNYVQQGGSFNMGNYRFPSESNLKEDCTFRNPNHPPCKSCRQVRHMFNVVSAYDHFRPDHAIEVSTYHADTGNPDFIFYSVVNKLPTQFDHCLEVHEGPLRLVRRLKLPSLPELQRVCGPLPNEQSGSDHLPLLAVFELA